LPHQLEELVSQLRSSVWAVILQSVARLWLNSYFIDVDIDLLPWLHRSDAVLSLAYTVSIYIFMDSVFERDT